MSGIRIKDKQSYITVKDVIVARSGIYIYSREEVLARGLKPAQVKDYYKEFRPPAVIVAAKDLFDLVPVPHQEHVEDEIDHTNFGETTSAIIGGPINVVKLGEDVALQGKIKFFTSSAHQYYMDGNKETSADYSSVAEVVDNPDEVGYDIILKEIIDVNNVAICAHGRGGKDVRVLDQAPESVTDITIGRKGMSILSYLGIGKPKGTFSVALKDALTKARTLDGAARDKEVVSVMGHIDGFKDSVDKEYIVGVVRDSFAHADEVLDPVKWKEVGPLVDGLYARCSDADALEAQKVLDSMKGEEKKEGDEEEDDEETKKKKVKDAADKEAADKATAEEAEKGRSKDTATLIQTAIADGIAKGMAVLEEKLPAMIDAGVKTALNIAAEPKGRSKDNAPINADGMEEDVNWAVDGVMGNRASR